MPNMTKGQEVAADVSALLRARTPLLWIVTREEARVEALLVEAAASAKYAPFFWDVAAGAFAVDGAVVGDEALRDPSTMLDRIRSTATADAPVRAVWIMRDLPAWFAGQGGVTTLRQIRNLCRFLPGVKRESAQAMIILSPSGEIPPELAGHATVIDWPLPDRAEIAALLDATIAALPEYENGADGKPDTTRPLRANAAPNGTREAAIEAAVGLTGSEAQACYAKSLVQLGGKIDPAVVAQEKRRVIAREKVLEWFEPLPGGLDAVGGLENVKAWLLSRTSAWSPEARAYGLPAPKGCVLVGVSGCGKSLLSKAIATGWRCPLLRLDLGALKSKYVGDSEANLRRALRTIEALGRCVVWIDEVEKALQGATSGSADGGVAADALGAVLTWMEERKGAAFVIATANNVEALPPEFLRKGRFDDVWFVDLPNVQERGQVLSAALRAHGRTAAKVDARAIAAVTEGFTGSEIASLVPDALYTAFADGAREITEVDLLAAARSVVPLSKTAGDKIELLRKWAVGKARFATRAEAAVAVSKSPNIDL